MRDAGSAPAILVIGNDPTEQHPFLAWQIRNNVRLNRARLYVVNANRIKLHRQATAFAQIAPDNGESLFAEYLIGNDSSAQNLGVNGTTAESLKDLRDKLKGEAELVVAFGSELRASSIVDLVKALPKAKFICLGDYANSRGASDMGLYPDLLPGYIPVGQAPAGDWLAEAPKQPGLNAEQMFSAAQAGALKALYIVGSNPVSRYHVDPAALKNTFVVVQDMFLTETATLADVILPPANAYEKSGTFTNTAGDVQILKKAGDVSTVKNDFEILVRIALAMQFDMKKLVPFGRPLRADMGQTRGAQSGEADRHAVWLEHAGIEPKLSPFDPTALFDEIQRLVPGYDVSRLNLLSGNDEHVEVPKASGAIPSHPELIEPANDTLFTSGTLGRYSNALNSVIERYEPQPPGEVPAD
jgi:NADH-quinone oxidoreductase subunit G